ncbi:helix-turn-helix domain-containing protein [Arthrobacter ruber]|uniref:helix-turn-helix domain-containing protein n=1 Tax=Arthrobacter ruber TaxID=1258893 RepID=UPI000CF47A2A|nr:helix-turn-helix domain-containing protein [Arthrobacter ruber]
MQALEGLTVAEVAERLGITRQSIHELIDRGRLDSLGAAGRTIIVDPASVERLLAGGHVLRRGRAWAEGSAWAAISLLSGMRASWMSASEVSRLKNRLRHSSAEDVHFLARDRAVTRRFRASSDAIPILEANLLATGGAAMRDAETAEVFGLSGGGGTYEGYAMSGDADQLAAGLGMREDPRGNVTIREVASNRAFDDDRVPVAAIALDLMDSLATRERSAGMRVLGDLLRG